MRIKRLYIRDFFCYSTAFIDFEQFNSALVVGKKENNDDVSNGVGKTTIFKAIEYALFNHSDINLENIIRDDQEQCSITLDFQIKDQEYRITRTRTRKGITDITLFRRSATEGSIEEAYHNVNNKPISDDKYWEDISGRRSADTEKEIVKLIKVNIKSFRIFVHFMQHDFTGLTTATPEKRKVILRDALSLTVYAKLEKIAKEKFSTLTKEAEKLYTTIETLGNPDNSINQLVLQLLAIEEKIAQHTTQLSSIDNQHSQLKQDIGTLTNKHAELEGKFSSLLVKKNSLNTELSSLNRSSKEYQDKKNNVIKVAKDLIVEVKQLESDQERLSALDFTQIDILTEQIVSNKEKSAQLNLTIQNDTTRCQKLKKPIPVDGECEECRQPISPEHREHCQAKLNAELQEKQANVKNCQQAINALSIQNSKHQEAINLLKFSQVQLELTKNQIAIKKQNITDKRSQHEEFKKLAENYATQLLTKQEEINQVEIELQQSSLTEANSLLQQISEEKKKLVVISNQFSLLTNQYTQLNNNQAVLKHDHQQRLNDRLKKTELTAKLNALQQQLVVYPLVIQAFSSSGIPNLVIQNVLDDLQIEANNLLSQLKPGIQLSFAIQKTKTDGVEADTLDIYYLVNGKKRYYEQLSGGMQLAVSFSLKLGLSFLLQKMAGVEIKLLLLDELDQSLDKASVNTFADIVKFFANEYTVLVITHNNDLKDKFSSAILVEQNSDMVSTASVVSSW